MILFLAVISAGIAGIKYLASDYDYVTHYFDKDYLALKGMKNDNKRYLLRAVRLGEKSSWIYCTLASLHSEEKQYNSAKSYYKTAINDLDLESTVILEGYIKDKNHVYQYCKKLENRDTKTFEVLSYYFTKDKNGVYFWNQKISGADSGTFTTLSHGYGKDKNNVYYENKKIVDADSKSFTAMENYGKDKSNVYFREKRVNGADPETFSEKEKWEETADGVMYMAEDKNNYYDGEEAVKQK